MLIDESFSCDFYFGDDMNDVKKMDYSLFSNTVTEVKNKILFGRIYWQKSIWKLIFKKEYSFYILLGQVDSLSTWIFLLCSIFFPKKKIFLWTHGWYGDESRMKVFLKKMFFSFADGVLLYGNYAKKLMIENGIPEKKLFVIYNSLDYDIQLNLRKNLRATDIYRTHFKNDFPNLVFIGRLDQVKKLDFLIDALKSLKGNGKVYNLTLLGEGAEKERLLNLVKECDLTDNVYFYGACYDETIISEFIYNADLCVSPGNVGLTAMHVMAYGTPVLTHDNFVNQMPEFEAIEQGRTGGFFRENDLHSLAEQIAQNITLVKNNREKIRQNCYQVIDERYNPHVQIELIKRLVQE